MTRMVILVALVAWLAFRLGYWFAPSYPVSVSIEQTETGFDVLEPGGSCLELHSCESIMTMEAPVARCVAKNKSIGPVDGHYTRYTTYCRSQGSVPYFGREQPGAWVATWRVGKNPNAAGAYV